jgi:hypothetical protein
VIGLSCGLVNAESFQLFPSTLVSRPALRFTLDERKSGERQVATLMYGPSTAERHPFAEIGVTESEEREDVVVRLLAAPGPAPDPAVEVAAIEALYTVVLNLNPEARFCFSAVGAPCTPQAVGSHAQVLREISAARDRLLVSGGLQGTPWRMVSMAPGTGNPGTPDRAAVRVTVGGAPLAGKQIFFSRAPHSGCMAMTGADGVAACELVDQHGDGDEHHDEHFVVANFPGDVTAERIFPPTTSIVSERTP